MDPPQRNPQDARSDLYAAGALGYFLLTGAPPFTGRTIAEVCAHHLHTTPVAPSRRAARIPPELEALILRCLAKSPEGRPESAAVLRSELLELSATWTERDAQRWWSEHHDAPSSPAPRARRAASGPEQAPTLHQALSG